MWGVDDLKTLGLGLILRERVEWEVEHHFEVLADINHLDPTLAVPLEEVVEGGILITYGTSSFSHACVRRLLEWAHRNVW